METLHGAGSGQGTAVLARAALVLEGDDGRMTLDETVLAQAVLRVRQGEEPLGIALVAVDAARALLLRLPQGLTLAAVVAEEAAPDASSTIPIVSDVWEAQKNIAEGVWVIVDAPTGRVLVDPDVQSIAQLQASQTFRAAFAVGGDAGIPAQTQEGATVMVWATVESPDDATNALSVGADGVVLVVTEDTFVPGLREFADALGGGQLLLLDDAQILTTVDAAALAWACRLTWVLPDYADAAGLRDELTKTVGKERRANRLAELPRLCALAGVEAEEEALRRFDMILRLPDLPTPNTAFLPPILVWLAEAEETLFEDLENAVRWGAAGIVVSPENITAAKRRIREIG